MRIFSPTSRLPDAIMVIANHAQVRDLGLTKLYKLLYFVDVEALRTLGRTITSAHYLKFPHGPVPQNGEECVRQLQKSGRVATEVVERGPYDLLKIEALKATHQVAFNSDELEVFDRVLTEYGKRTARDLRDLSHLEPAWLSAQSQQRLDEGLMMYGPTEDPDGL